MKAFSCGCFCHALNKCQTSFSFLITVKTKSGTDKDIYKSHCNNVSSNSIQFKCSLNQHIFLDSIRETDGSDMKARYMSNQNMLYMYRAISVPPKGSNSNP